MLVISCNKRIIIVLQNYRWTLSCQQLFDYLFAFLSVTTVYETAQENVRN